ncbi:MAG TPA: glycosyltransferase family 1 protein [Vicinamibacterales bacterium]|nr:glycosyltransferase family 1 protein [Vicinamibacterales bacterium]
MRVAIDGRELTGRPTGVGRYLAELLRHWEARADRAARQLALLIPGDAGLAAPVPDGVEIRRIARGGGTRWEQFPLARALREGAFDVFFAPAYSAPLAHRVPIVLAVHDVSFIAHPEWFSWREGLRRRLVTRLSAARARIVLTFSAFSAAEIRRLLGVDPARLRVIPHGVDRRPADAVPKEPLVLFAGSLLARRRIPDLLRAFAEVAPKVPGARLVIAGENRTWPREDPAALARALGIAGLVHFAEYVSDDELARLYGRARVFVFVSEYEGFGLTPLEAMAAGAAVVAADTPVAREIYGPAAWLVPPGDVPALASAIERLLVDEVRRGELLAHAPAVLARYSWDRAAGETMAALEEAARRSWPS